MPELKDVKFTEEIKDCKVCRLAKLTRQPRKKICCFHQPLMIRNKANAGGRKEPSPLKAKGESVGGEEEHGNYLFR